MKELKKWGVGLLILGVPVILSWAIVGEPYQQWQFPLLAFLCSLWASAMTYAFIKPD